MGRMGAVFPPSRPRPYQTDNVTCTNSMAFKQTQYHVTKQVPKPFVPTRKNAMCNVTKIQIFFIFTPFPSPDMHADVCPPVATPFLSGVPVIVHYGPPDCTKSPTRLETNHDRLIAPRRLSRI